jgi:hypothetical protein
MGASKMYPAKADAKAYSNQIAREAFVMGRSFESVRMGVNEVSARWTRAGRALKKEDQAHALRLAEMAKKHSSEAFYALDDPLEAVIFSVLIEIMKEKKPINKIGEFK